MAILKWGIYFDFTYIAFNLLSCLAFFNEVPPACSNHQEALYFSHPCIFPDVFRMILSKSTKLLLNVWRGQFYRSLDVCFKSQASDLIWICFRICTFYSYKTFLIQIKKVLNYISSLGCTTECGIFWSKKNFIYPQSLFDVSFLTP